MARTKWYIEVDSYWQNSPSVFIGPFMSKRLAELYAEDSDAISCYHTASDVRNNVRYQIRNTTHAREAGMNKNNVCPPALTYMPNDVTDLNRLQHFINETNV